MVRRTFIPALLVGLIAGAAFAVPARAACTLDPTAIPIITGPNPLYIASGDFNADGLTDLAVTNSDHLNGGDANNLVVLLRTGPTSFAPPQPHALPIGGVPHAVIAADFNEDGILDLAVANKFMNSVSVLRGAGSGGVANGNFLPRADYPVGGWPFQLDTGDFNGDGILDIVMAINSTPGSVRFLYGQGSGGVGSGLFGAVSAPLPLSNPASGLEVADFNADGIPDLVATEYESGTVGVLIAHGSGGVPDGTFEPVVHYNAGIRPFDIAVSDFNGDGVRDLAVCNNSSGGTAILIGLSTAGVADGTFSTPYFVPSGNNTTVMARDVDGDGIADLLIGQAVGLDNGTIRFYHGNGSGGVGNGTFSFAYSRTINADPYQFAWADVTGDGVPDLIASAFTKDYIAVLPLNCGPQPPDPNAPVLTDVRDVPNDDGGQVFLTWTASALDVPGGAVNQYRVWRRIPPAAAAAARSELAAGDRRITATAGAEGTEIVYWEALVTLPAQRLEGYGYTAPTTQDSMKMSNPWTAFFVSALTADINVFYSSNVDSGYSVDNKPPGPPHGLAGAPVEGAFALEWEQSTETDLDGYHLYRGATGTFEDAEAIADLDADATAFADPEGSPLDTYWLTAFDTHENESEPAMLAPSVQTDVTPGRLSLALGVPHPNPSAGRFAIPYALPDGAPARLEVVDVSGRIVHRVDIEAGHAAGRFEAPVGFTRALAPGIYLVRLTHTDGTLRTRAVVLR